jgi:hypothetical protein
VPIGSLHFIIGSKSGSLSKVVLDPDRRDDRDTDQGGPGDSQPPSDSPSDDTSNSPPPSKKMRSGDVPQNDQRDGLSGRNVDMLLAGGNHCCASFEPSEIGWKHCETDCTTPTLTYSPSTGLSIVDIRRHNYRFESDKDRVESWLSTPPDNRARIEW